MSVALPASESREIRFFHRGRVVRLSDVPATLSVLDWLREDQHFTGTKEGCNEGDCGACTVVVGELPEHTDSPAQATRGLRLRPVNACIRFLPSLHGKALFTVEDLRGQDGKNGLHPAQQALVDCHGSQCGFCTPGFAMTLWSSYENHCAAGTRPDRGQLADELAGNLCRCTGYRPILEAGAQMFDHAPVSLDTAPVIAALRDIVDGAPAAAPRTLAQLAQRYAASPTARLVAGGTDVGLWVTKQFRDLGEVIPVTDVDELKAITHTGSDLRIGAGASLEAAWAALAGRAPSLTEAWRRFASPPIRHAGTMGGNVANGSPIGDSAPVLMALDALVELRRSERVRRLPLDEFYTGYQANRLEPGEFVQALVIPDAAWTRQLRAYKISKRFDSDISAVFAALAIELDGERVVDLRLVFGGMAAVVKRAASAEAALRGQPWRAATLAAAQGALASDFTPLDDMRASAAYRLRVAQNLLQRFWLETRPGAAASAAATSIWSVA
ncbi:MAG: xanthine dehydrogenase small subunit [Burkholderiaceae bacterium]